MVEKNRRGGVKRALADWPEKAVAGEIFRVTKKRCSIKKNEKRGAITSRADFRG